MNANASTFRVVASIVHDQYQGLGSENDVAVLLLNQSLQDVKTANLAASTPRLGDSVWVVGYGVRVIGTVEETERNVQVLAGNLQKTQLRIRENPFCDIPRAGFVTAKGMLCTQGVKQGSSACMGDSGGGLFKHLPNGEKEQVGIVSYGDSRCMAEDAGVFTDVATVKNWIHAAIKRLEGLLHPIKVHLDDHVQTKLVTDFNTFQHKQHDQMHTLIRLQGEQQHNVRLYTLHTNFSKMKNLTISLCGHGNTNTQTTLMVMNSHDHHLFKDNASCPGSNLSKITFQAKNASYVIGLATHQQQHIPLTLHMFAH